MCLNLFTDRQLLGKQPIRRCSKYPVHFTRYTYAYSVSLSVLLTWKLLGSSSVLLTWKLFGSSSVGASSSLKFDCVVFHPTSLFAGCRVII